MRKLILITVLISITLMACSLQPAAETGEEVAFTFQPTMNANGTISLSLALTGGTLNISRAGAEQTSVTIQTTVAAWQPVEKFEGEITSLTQSNRPTKGTPGDPAQTWQVSAGKAPLTLKLDGRDWAGKLDLTGVNSPSFLLIDSGSQSTIIFDEPGGKVSNLVIDTVRSNMTVLGLANASAEQVIIEAVFGNYRLDFSGKLRQDMQVAITPGFGVMRLEIPRTANVEITYNGRTRSINIQGEWTHGGGTTYRRDNPGALLKIIVNSDQADLAVALVD